MSGLTNRLTKNVRFNIFARDITNGFASEFLFYKFTRDIGNRFLSNVFSWSFTRDIKNRFKRNFRFNRFTKDITNRFTRNFSSKCVCNVPSKPVKSITGLLGTLQTDLLEKSGLIKLREKTQTGLRATKEFSDLWSLTLWRTATWLLILETSTDYQSFTGRKSPSLNQDHSTAT